MWSQRLSPGVQDGQKASLGAKVLRIGRDLEQCGGTGLKEQGKQLSLVLPHQWHKLVWDADDKVIVADRQEFLLALLQPLVARSGLTLRAVPVAAGVIRDGLVLTVYARIAMTAEGGCAAARDGIEHLALRPGQGSAVPLSKAIACNTNDIGHLERWPAHRFLSSCTAGSAICSSGLTAA
jgi:hypothetical protein